MLGITWRHKALIKDLSRLRRFSHMLRPSNKLTMPLMGSFVFILGLVVASTIAADTATSGWLSTVPPVFNTHTRRPNNNNPSSVVTSISTTDRNTNTRTYISNTTSNMNITSTNSTTMPPITKQKGGTASQRPTTLSTTPKPIGPSKSTSATSTKMDKRATKKPQARDKSDSTGIIILVVIIIVIIGFGVACLVARKRGRRYSVDFTSRPDEANIPLSTMEPDLPADTVPQNGLQTFESTETTTKEPEEPAEKPEVEEQKTEADKSVDEPSAESAAPSAAPAPSPDSSEDEPKKDVVEQSPPSPVEPSVEEKTDDEGADSNKTSVESLKEPNENNSNNAGFSQKRDLELGKIFWDVALDSPV